MAPRKKGWANLSPSTRARYARYYGGDTAKAKRRYERDKPMNIRAPRRARPPEQVRGELPRGFEPRRVSSVTIRETDEGPEYDFVMDSGEHVQITADADAYGPMWGWIRRYDIDAVVDSPGKSRAAA